MQDIKNFLTAIDIFGMTFSFRYKNKERYQTALGGLIILLFLILVIVVLIYYFIPFSKRKNYTIVYYTMNLADTEEVNLFQSNSNFALGLSCEDNSAEKYQIHDLMKMTPKYTSFVKNSDGTNKKNSKSLKTHKCTYEDFYNKYDQQVDFLGLSKFECLAEKTDTIQGIYADQIFSYFEFTVAAKNDSVLDELDRFLFVNDCKLQIYYTDIIIDLNNYEEPQTQYLNELFIQLNPVYYIKRNIFYMNQYFSNDDYLMFVFGDDDEGEIKPLYSRYEEYSLYKGFNRTSNKVDNYDKYAKVFIRADLKKTIIKRKYQKFMEFYADASSLLIALYEIINIIFSYVDTFYAFHSVAKELFFFKGVEEENNYNIFKKGKQMEELLSIFELKEKTEEKKSIGDDSKGLKNNPPKNRNKDIDKEESEYDENEKEIKIYNNRKNQSGNKKIQDSTASKMKEKGNRQKNYKNQIQYEDKYKQSMSEKSLDSENYYQKNKMSQMRRNRNNNYGYNQRDDYEFNESIGTNMEKYSESISASSSVKVKKRNKKEKIKNSFNIFEIPIVQFFRCCMSKNMTIKSNVYDNTNEIIHKKLDIITYVRNNIVFDLMNQSLIDEDKKDVINFLCRPVVSPKKNKKNLFDDFYKVYKDKEFNKFSNKIEGLIQKQQKDNIDNKLISRSKEHLQEFV